MGALKFPLTTQVSRVGSGRFYQTPDGEYPSVTNLLSVIGKPALLNWMALTERKMCVEAAANLNEDLPLTPKMSRPSYIATLEKRIGKEKAGKKELEKAGEIGSACHALIEWNLRKELGQVVGPEPRVPDAALWAFMAYEDWRKTVKLEPLWIEQTVYSKTHGYAGTMDLAASIEIPLHGRVWAVLDWKTGKAIYSEAALQSAAYAHAYHEMGHCESVPYGVIVRLPKVETDPQFEVKVITPEAQGKLLPVFLSVMRLWEWLEEEKVAKKGAAA